MHCTVARPERRVAPCRVSGSTTFDVDQAVLNRRLRETWPHVAAAGGSAMVGFAVWLFQASVITWGSMNWRRISAWRHRQVILRMAPPGPAWEWLWCLVMSTFTVPMGVELGTRGFTAGVAGGLVMVAVGAVFCWLGRPWEGAAGFNPPRLHLLAGETVVLGGGISVLVGLGASVALLFV